MEEHLDVSGDPQPPDNGLVQPVLNDLAWTLVPSHHPDTFDKAAKDADPPRSDGQASSAEPTSTQDAGAKAEQEAAEAPPELAERGPSTGELGGLEAAAGLGTGLGLDVDNLRRLVSGALNSIGAVATDVVSELRQLTRGSSPDDSED